MEKKQAYITYMSNTKDQTPEAFSDRDNSVHTAESPTQLFK